MPSGPAPPRYDALCLLPFLLPPVSRSVPLFSSVSIASTRSRLPGSFALSEKDDSPLHVQIANHGGLGSIVSRIGRYLCPIVNVCIAIREHTSRVDRRIEAPLRTGFCESLFRDSRVSRETHGSKDERQKASWRRRRAKGAQVFRFSRQRQVEPNDEAPASLSPTRHSAL